MQNSVSTSIIASNYRMKKYLSAALLFVLFSACNNPQLPVYGDKISIEKDGTIDSMDYQLPDFTLTDQEGNNISYSGKKILVADFFFTSCPSICPKMMKEMLRVQEKYEKNDEVQILSFSIDPVRDSVPRLKTYANKLGIESLRWHLLTGNKDSIYNLAEKFLVSAEEDPDAPGGHIHSGNFILVDKHKRIRGYYDGTDETSVNKLLEEMDMLIREN